MDSQHRQLFGSPAPPQGPIPPNNSPVAGYLPTERVQPNVLRSALEAAAQNTHHRGTTGGSARPYQAQPRLRRTTAVSSLRSNRPRTFSQGRELYENNYNHQRGYGTQNNHEQHRRLVDQQNNTNRQAPHGFQNGYYADAEVVNLSPLLNECKSDPKQADDFAYLQHSLYSAAQLISGQTAMPSNVVATLTSEIHDLSQLCIELRRKTRDNARVLQGEVNRLRHLISDQQRLVQNALAERDRACAERDRHEVEYVEALATQRGIEQKKVKEVEKKNEDTIKYLRRQIQFKNEQISAKRSLWMENHRDAGAKRKIDPFATPTATGTAKYNHLFETPTGLDVPDPHFYSGLPHEYWPYHHASGSKNRGARTHCNSPDLTPSILRAADAYSITSDEFESTAVIPFKTEDQIAEEFRKDFEETYGLVEQWVQSFASKVNDIEFDQKVSHDSSLWSFILGCTIGTLPDAHDRTIVLLRNPATRGFLVMRMIVQYIYLYIWKASAFCGADVKQGQKILYAEQQLRSKGKLSIRSPAF